jgi:hypothetical protein
MADDRSDDPRTPTGLPSSAEDAAAGAQPAGASRRALTFALVALAGLVAVIVTVALSRNNASNPVDDVSSALAANAELLAGPLNPTDLAHARCVKESGTEFRCTPVVGNAAETTAIDVVWKDGVLSKRLAGTQLTAAPRAGDDVAAALIADERVTAGRTVKYGCAFTSSMAPGGGAAAGAGGFRCATLKPLPGEDEPLQRYVEFAADGTVTRDFMLTGA